MTVIRGVAATDATPEQRFLLACIGRTFDVDVRMPEEPIDWASVLALALDSGLASLLDTAVREMDAPMPADAADRLRALDTATRVRARYFVEPTMRRVLQALADRGLQPIVVKGAALAYTAYGDPVHRTFADLDILLLRELEQARTVLEEAGFRPQTDQGADHHLPPLYADDGHVGVELHHRLLPRRSPYALDLAGLVTRAQSVQVAGTHAWVPAPVDALHLACIHQSYAHRYRRYLLRSLTDLLALTTHYRSDLDWDLFLSIVKHARTAGAVYWPLRLARAWLNAPVPESVLDALAPAPVLDRVLAAFAEPANILDRRERVGDNDVLSELVLDLSLRTGCSWAEQIRSCGRSLFPPPSGVSHLTPAVTQSPWRYAAHLSRPARLAHGWVAVNRLIARSLSR